MRTAGTLTGATPAPSSSSTTTKERSAAVPHSPWHSPVPYLFGGLAAMLGLIAFALLILACSYWKLSGSLEMGDDQNERDEENEKGSGDQAMKAAPVYEEKIVVIMAGDEKPTFLATPIVCSEASCFGEDNIGGNSSSKDNENNLENCSDQKQKQEESSNSGNLQVLTTTTITTSTHQRSLMSS